MNVHSKYTDYKIIYKDTQVERLEHINDCNLTIRINYYESGQIKQESWFLNNKWHSEDSPAIIEYYESNQIQGEYWFLNGMFHREDGPTIVKYYESGQIYEEMWNLNDKCHKEDGPAIIYYSESGNITSQEFYLNNMEYTYDDFVKTPEYQAYLKLKSTTIFD